MEDRLKELADEFDLDAEMLESQALIYFGKNMIEQYNILWHEAAVYRCCAYRLRQT